MPLNLRQRVFVKKYVKYKNATKAAKLAGYSKKCASSIGERLLRNAEVQKAVERSLAKVSEKAELSAADVLKEIRKLAFANLTKAYAEDGTLLPLHEMPGDIQLALQSIETDEIFRGRGGSRVKIGETRKIKLVDKIRALEMLAKHFKLLTELHEHSGKDGGPMVILTMPSNGSEAPPVETKKDETK